MPRRKGRGRGKAKAQTIQIPIQVKPKSKGKRVPLTFTHPKYEALWPEFFDPSAPYEKIVKRIQKRLKKEIICINILRLLNNTMKDSEKYSFIKSKLSMFEIILWDEWIKCQQVQDIDMLQTFHIKTDFHIFLKKNLNLLAETLIEDLGNQRTDKLAKLGIEEFNLPFLDNFLIIKANFTKLYGSNLRYLIKNGKLIKERISYLGSLLFFKSRPFPVFDKWLTCITDVNDFDSIRDSVECCIIDHLEDELDNFDKNNEIGTNLEMITDNDQLRTKIVDDLTDKLFKMLFTEHDPWDDIERRKRAIDNSDGSECSDYSDDESLSQLRKKLKITPLDLINPFEYLSIEIPNKMIPPNAPEIVVSGEYLEPKKSDIPITEISSSQVIPMEGKEQMRRKKKSKKLRRVWLQASFARSLRRMKSFLNDYNPDNPSKTLHYVMDKFAFLAIGLLNDSTNILGIEKLKFVERCHFKLKYDMYIRKFIKAFLRLMNRKYKKLDKTTYFTTNRDRAANLIILEEDVNYNNDGNQNNSNNLYNNNLDNKKPNNNVPDNKKSNNNVSDNKNPNNTNLDNKNPNDNNPNNDPDDKNPNNKNLDNKKPNNNDVDKKNSINNAPDNQNLNNNDVDKKNSINNDPDNQNPNNNDVDKKNSINNDPDNQNLNNNDVDNKNSINNDPDNQNPNNNDSDNQNLNNNDVDNKNSNNDPDNQNLNNNDHDNKNPNNKDLDNKKPKSKNPDKKKPKSKNPDKKKPKSKNPNKKKPKSKNPDKKKPNNNNQDNNNPDNNKSDNNNPDNNKSDNNNPDNNKSDNNNPDNNKSDNNNRDNSNPDNNSDKHLVDDLERYVTKDSDEENNRDERFEVSDEDSIGYLSSDSIDDDAPIYPINFDELETSSASD